MSSSSSLWCFFQRRVLVLSHFFSFLCFLSLSHSLLAHKAECTVINIDNTFPSITCYVIEAYITIFSSTKLDTTSIFQINNIIKQTITNGDLISVDNRLLDISWNAFDPSSPISSAGDGGGGGGGDGDPSGGGDPNGTTPEDVNKDEGLFGLGWPWWYFALIGGGAIILLVLCFALIVS